MIRGAARWAVTRAASIGLNALVFQCRETGEVHISYGAREIVDVRGIARHSHREPVADDHAVFAGMALVVPLLVHQLPATFVGLLVAGVCFLVLLHTGPTARKANQAFERASIGNLQI